MFSLAFASLLRGRPIINDCSVNYPINNNNIITLF